MTREEAIEVLKRDIHNAKVTHHLSEHYEMAIKALEQDTDKEMFDDWHEAPSYAMTLEQAREAVHELRKEIVKLRKEPCEDAISRSSLLGKLDDCYKEKAKVAPNNMAEGFVQVEKLIKQEPTVTPTHKVWKWNKGVKPSGLRVYICSNCGSYYPLPDGLNFCPNCGADMRGNNND